MQLQNNNWKDHFNGGCNDHFRWAETCVVTMMVQEVAAKEEAVKIYYVKKMHTEGSGVLFLIGDLGTPMIDLF